MEGVVVPCLSLQTTDHVRELCDQIFLAHAGPDREIPTWLLAACFGGAEASFKTGDRFVVTPMHGAVHPEGVLRRTGFDELAVRLSASICLAIAQDFAAAYKIVTGITTLALRLKFDPVGAALVLCVDDVPQAVSILLIDPHKIVFCTEREVLLTLTITEHETHAEHQDQANVDDPGIRASGPVRQDA